MRFLAIDLGARRTGLAVGDDVTGIVTPLDVIEARSETELARALAGATREHEPDAIVVGLPLNMDGTEGDQARDVRRIATELSRQVSLPVHFQDERLTSYAADQQMARSGRTHGQKKRRRDALAAAEILRDWLGRSDDGGSEERR